MIWAVIITWIMFVLGNVTWPLFDEQKVFYVPQAFFFISMLLYIKSKVDNKIQSILITYLLLLSFGNLVKQLFYNETLKQINDYVWGGLVTIRLIIKITWTISKQDSGMK